jgi:protein-disulfide isomerase
MAAAAAVAATVVVTTLPAGAQDADTKKRLDALEANQKAILQQLQEIKSLLQQRPPAPQGAAAKPAAPPTNFDLSIDGAPARGRADAKLTIVEFSDFECPFCGRFTRETRAQLEHDYVDTGKVRMVFRHFPLERIHPHALRASEAAECAKQQNKFWDMHAKLFANQQALNDSDLAGYARSIGADATKFQQCLAASPLARIRQDQADGTMAAITGTPTFFFGTLTKDGKIRVTKRIVGAAPFPNFKATIDALLSES